MFLELAGATHDLHDESRTDFDRQFMDSATISLGKMLGEEVASAAIKALCGDPPRARAETIIPKLNRLFGVGAPVISKIMLKDFFIRLDIPWEESKSFDPASLLDCCRREFLAKQKVGQIA